MHTNLSRAPGRSRVPSQKGHRRCKSKNFTNSKIPLPISRRWRVAPTVLSGAGRNPPGRQRSADEVVGAHRRPPRIRLICVAPQTFRVAGYPPTVPANKHVAKTKRSFCEPTSNNLINLGGNRLRGSKHLQQPSAKER